MIGVDANILIRFLTGDDEQQTKIVYKIFKQVESEKKQLFVPLLVVLEMLWVLETVYETSRKEIIEVINNLLLLPILKFEHHSAIQKFILIALTNKCNLSDLLIAHSAQIQGCEKVLTFDKKASNFSLFELAK
jgi:predicted nucleic-acid-binding protein